MEKKRFTSTGLILLAAFVGLLGWYFWASYIGHRVPLQIQEKMLTVHDDLFAIDGRHDGSRAAVGKFGMILLTRDGGKSWKEQPSGTSRALSATSFADDQHGFVVGSGGTILVTSDGGISWKVQTSGTRDQLLGIYASSPTRVYVVGAFGTLFSTSDGGGKWSKHEFSWDKLIPRIIKEGGYMEPNLNAVHFTSAEVGWIVGEFGLVLQTRDGGQTWVSQNYGGDLPQLFAVTFRDERSGWAIGQQGILIRTMDGGKHWVGVELGTKKNLYGISLDGERGVIVGDGIVFASHDGGSSWKRLESVPEDRWLGGVAMKSREGIAVGQGGTIRLLDLDKNPREKEAGAP